jgi:HEAT repeat protein
MPRFLTSVIASSLLLGMVGFSVVAQEGQPETLEQSLTRHHIGLTKSALIGALRDSDPEGRSLAAQKLAQDHVTDAIPAITAALSNENAPLTRLSLAFSLAQLGSDDGLSTLRNVCDDVAAGGYARVVAAQYLEWMHNDKCDNAVIEVLRSGGDRDARILALSLIPSLHFSGNDSKRAFEATVEALTDDSPSVRMTASSALSKLGNTSAVPYLEGALRKEENESCILQMRRDLERLRKTQRQQ